MPSKINSAPTSMKSAMRIAKRPGSVLLLPPVLDVSVPWELVQRRCNGPWRVKPHCGAVLQRLQSLLTQAQTNPQCSK